MIILGTNSIKASGGYQVDNSLRFGSNTYLTNTFGSAPTLATKNTFSMWFKRSSLGTLQQLYTGNNNAASVVINTNDTIAFYNNSGDVSGQLLGPRLYRDTSAWMHFVFVYDSTQGTAANRLKAYINGVLETSFNNNGYPEQNVASAFGTNGTDIKIGTRTNNDRIFEGYIAETAFVDGQALGADSFGEFDDSGIWKPIDISGLTFGNNGFYLENKQSGTGTNSSGMGADTSGNDFHFAVTNLAAIDQSTDTCTNNFATMNPLAYRLDSGVSLPTYSEGNTVVSYADDSGAGKSTMATIGFQNGKWYWEYKVGTANDTIFGGITRMDYDPNDNFAGRSCFYNKTGAFSVGTGTGGTADGSYGNSYTTDNIIGVAFDCDNGVIWFSKDGTWQNSATQSEIEAGTTTNSATTGITLNQFWSPFFEGANGGMSANFGSPAYAISSGNSDGNGYGNFEYAVPSGYYALCTKNLSEYG